MREGMGERGTFGDWRDENFLMGYHESVTKLCVFMEGVRGGRLADWATGEVSGIKGLRYAFMTVY